MKNPASKFSRRNFLVAAGAGGAATVGAVAGKFTQTQPKRAGAANGGKGYQVTDHVLKYYNTAKV